MKDNSVTYFYGTKGENYTKISDFCKKTNMFFFECTSLDELMYILLGAESNFVIVDKDANVTHKQLEELADKKKFYYLDTTYSGLKKNIMVVEDMEKTIDKIRNDNIQTEEEISEKKMYCYQVVNEELDKLYFRGKHIVTKYLADMVYEHFKSKVQNRKCAQTLVALAERFETTATGIERAIRFAIKRAFESCEDKQVFYNISKAHRAPTMKEMISYLLGKVIYGNKKYFK